jgi:carbon storage regulator
MLILMRRQGETICIGNDVTVTVMSVDRNRVRIGVDAPRDVIVDREEVAEKKRMGIAAPKKVAASG